MGTITKQGYFGTPPIITNGLVLHLDAGSRQSYVSGSTIWTDLSGNLNSGSLVNSPTFNTSNQGNILLNGTNQYISLVTSSLQFTNTQAYTLSSWVYWTETLSTTEFPICYGTTARAYYIGLDGGASVGTNLCMFDYYDGTFFKGINSAANSIPKNAWFNITGTVSTTNRAAGMNLYLNGRRLVTTIRQDGLPGSIDYSGAAAANIGLRQNIGYLKGNIAQAMIYNRELSAQEVAQNYNALKTRFGLI